MQNENTTREEPQVIKSDVEKDVPNTATCKYKISYNKIPTFLFT